MAELDNVYNNQKIYANVIVDITNDAVDKPFLYRISDELIDVIKNGEKVIVPFGKADKEIEGFVVDIMTKEEVKNSDAFKNDKYFQNDNAFENLKYIKRVAEKKLSVNSILMNMAIYMSREYMTPLTTCLKTVLPVKKVVRKNSKQQDAILKYEKSNEAKPELNDEQKEIIDKIKISLNENKYSNHLIYGVTGSGKTEVYLNIIEEALKLNKQVIVLIPEISLTYQTVTRLKNRFDKNVGIINSKMSEGDRYIQIQKCIKGEIDILVGPRSAVFAPFENLGLIIMDEEDDNSYKSDISPRYMTRDIAEYRCREQNAVLIGISATPSFYYYHKAITNNGISMHRLTTRAVKDAVLPSITIVDMGKEFRDKNKSIFSSLLKQKINETLKRKEQIILFFNKRGYDRALTCMDCGHNFKCPHCDVSLIVHNDNKMKCHYCGYEEVVPMKCPNCESTMLNAFGIGIQKIEVKAMKEFPSAKIIRMDYDTTREKDGHDKIIESFKKHEADILIGTQMVVKGHDFPNVTLVAVLLADNTLNGSSYKAAEKGFSLLTQVAGRSGRSKLGECIIQTYEPDNQILDYIKNADYNSFYKDEIVFREQFNYPPFSKILMIYIKSNEEYLLEKASEDLANELQNINKINNLDIDVLGPALANPYKQKDFYYKFLMVKCKNRDILKFVRKSANDFSKTNFNNKMVKIIFDIDE